MGYVYILHFDRPYKHARHYIGYSNDDPEKEGGRIEKHRNGQGANLTKVLKENGIGFTLDRVWVDVDRNFERRKKKSGGGSRHCTICKRAKRMLREEDPQERGQAQMVKEAIRRGYKQGTKIKPIFAPKQHEFLILEQDKPRPLYRTGLDQWDDVYDRVFYYHGIAIYSEGKWAEIIE